jgi:hypothetical protein
MIRTRYIIGALVLVVLTLILTYHRYTDFSPDQDQIAEYEELNKRLILTKGIGFVESASELRDSSAGAIFERLKREGRLVSVEDEGNRWIIYKIKHEKVRPISGIGLNFFSHYLFYTGNGKKNFEGYFSNSYKEERYITSEKIKADWYYVIGEHFSD